MYHNFKELFASAKAAGGLAKAIMANEVEQHGRTEEEVYAELENRWQVMQKSARKALDGPQDMTGNLISGQAQRQQEYAAGYGYTGETMNRAMAWALSASEVNASMGRICAAPTAGACGVLPAVMLAAVERRHPEKTEILDALLVAAGVGAIITRNATVSGAEGGCQAECGAAAAMASAAAVALAGGTNRQVGSAVAITLMNCMGLICDPVAGLVQLPCSFRNASQTANALISADMALAGQDSVIPADEAVDAMGKVGRSLSPTLRETALGGVAVSPTGRRLRTELRLDEISASGDD